MVRSRLQPVLHYLRASLGFAEAVAETDGELLGRFAGGRDEGAFEVLLRRHGPLVWGVCRRMLGSDHAAEDAFQATFLVLVHKASSIRKQTSVASWLYGVAYRIALKAHADARRRGGPEAGEVTALQADVLTEASAREVRAILDEEVGQLAERLRIPLVLCCLEGRSKAEAARQLGWKEGTVASRLARARQRLRVRLERRGVFVSAGLFGVLLAEQGTAAVPVSVTAAALRMAGLCAAGDASLAGVVSSPAAALAQGVLKTMSVTRLKMGITLAVVLGALAAGAGWATHHRMAGTVAESPGKDEPKPAGIVFPPRPATDRLVRTDTYGDPLPPGAIARLGSVQFRLKEVQMVFSADGKTIHAGGSDLGVQSWDRSTGKLLRHKQLQGPTIPKPGPSFEGLSPDGKVLAVLGGEGVYLYDTGTGEERQRLRTGRTSHRRFVFSPDSKFLATATSLGGRQATRLWEVATGKERWALEHADSVGDMAFSPDGKVLVAACGWLLRLWDTTTGKELRSVRTEGAWVAVSLAVSPDGKTVAAGSRDGKVELWDVATLKRLETFMPFSGPTNTIQMAYSPDGSLLAIGGYTAIILWDVAARKELRRLPEREVQHLAFAPDGKTLACAGAFQFHLWDVASGKQLHDRPGHGCDVHSVAVAPDGKVVATAGRDYAVRLWDAATGKPLPVALKHSAFIRSCAFSPDGKMLLSGCGRGDDLRLWSADTGKELRRFVIKDLHGGPQRHEVLVCNLSADGKRLAAISWGWVKVQGKDRESQQLTVWDARTGAVLACRPFGGSLNSCFTPDGNGVTVDSSERLTIEDTMTGKEGLTLPGDLGYPAAFSPDGKLLAVGVHKKMPAQGLGLGGMGRSLRTENVRVVEVATGKEIFHVDGWFHFVAFSPDKQVLAAADDRALCLWDVATGQPLFRRPWAEGLSTGRLGTPMNSLAFLPDGKALVTGMADGTALVWDLAPQTWPAAKVVRDIGRPELEALWADLLGDAGKAYRAVRALSASPARSVAFLRDRLRPVAGVDPKLVQRLVADLDSDQYTVRKAASEELTRLGERIEPELRQALEGRPSAEVRRRVRWVLDAMRATPTAREVRTHRAIQALERMGTAEARQVLQQLATGAPAARETREAREALEYLARVKGAGRPGS